MNYNEVDGDLIKLAQAGTFDVITHGCNCFCTMKSGIAPQMDKAFDCGHYPMEAPKYKGDINKLGTIDYREFIRGYDDHEDGKNRIVAVVNSYTQYDFRPVGIKPALDYQALVLCMRKINHLFKGKHIGLPKIGAGLAGGDWPTIRTALLSELRDMDIIVVNYKP